MDATQLLQIAKLDDQTLLEFVQDTINHLKGEKVPFLSKYYSAFGEESRSIVPVRELIVSLIE